MQTSDLPSGFVTCASSGAIDDHLAFLRSTDPTGYQTASAEWDKEKAAGATAAWVQVASSSQAQCDRLINGQQSAPGSPRYVLSYAIEFKDSAGAASSYGSEVFGLNPADFQKLGGDAVKGVSTGLGANSAVVTVVQTDPTTQQQQDLYLAIWQKGKYLIAFLALNLTSTDAKHAVGAMYARIN